MADDKLKIAEEIAGLRNETFTARSQHHYELASNELLDKTTKGTSREEDVMLKAIEDELMINAPQYRNTLNVCDGNEKTAAKHILDFMISGVQHGFHWPMVKFLAHFDGICARVVRR